MSGTTSSPTLAMQRVAARRTSSAPVARSGKICRERLLRADPCERVERVHLEERHAAREDVPEAFDDSRALRLELSEDDRGRDLLLDGLALEELDDLDDFAHFPPPTRVVFPPAFPSFASLAGNRALFSPARATDQALGAPERLFSRFRATMGACAARVAWSCAFWPEWPASWVLIAASTTRRCSPRPRRA